MLESGQKALLATRKKYEKIQSQIARVTSHEDFRKGFQYNSITPKGLQVKVKCDGLLPDYTNVREKFKYTSNMAENGIQDGHDPPPPPMKTKGLGTPQQSLELVLIIHLWWL